MKIDTSIMASDLRDVPRLAAHAEQLGFDGIWTAEAGHDPYLPAAVAAPATERVTIGTNIAVAFPGILLALFFAVIFGVGATGAVFAIGLAGAPAFGRLTQTLVAGVESRDYVSAALVAVSLVLLHRSGEGDGPPEPTVDARTRATAWALVALTAVVVVLGVVTTGAGPHSGDAEVGYRFAVDPALMGPRVYSICGPRRDRALGG